MSDTFTEISTWLTDARNIQVHKAGNASALIDWYNAGADGQINWGSEGDFDACVSIASKYMDDDQAKGFCQNRHIDATGEPAGKAPGEVKKGKILNSVIAGVVASHNLNMSSAMVGGIAGIATAIALASKSLNGSVNPTTVQSAVQNAVGASVTIDSSSLADALYNLYSDAGNAGISVGASQTGFTNVDGAKALNSLMQNRADILKGLDKTTLSLISDSISQGLINGQDLGDIGTQINALVNNPTRLDMILLTETSRAYNAGLIGAYQQAGIQQFNWICTESACQPCEEMQGVHDIDEQEPPLHPNCQCEISPVMAEDLTKDALGSFTPKASISAQSALESATKGYQLRNLGKWESATIAHQFAAKKYREASAHERSAHAPNSQDNARILDEKAGEQDQLANMSQLMSVAPTHSPAEVSKYENPKSKPGSQDWGYLDPAENVLLPDTVASFETEDESSSSEGNIKPISVAYIQGQQDATKK
jgi:SPP1 gp7 family putative phage head morphogenesis protein